MLKTSRLGIIAEQAMHHGQTVTLGDEIITIPTWLLSPSFDYKAQKYNAEVFSNAEKFINLWNYLYKGKLNIALEGQVYTHVKIWQLN